MEFILIYIQKQMNKKSNPFSWYKKNGITIYELTIKLLCNSQIYIYIYRYVNFKYFNILIVIPTVSSQYSIGIMTCTIYTLYTTPLPQHIIVIIIFFIVVLLIQ